VRVAACLANQQAPDTPLEVQSPSLVARYLERVGRADIALAAPQVKESSAGYQAGSHYYPGQRLLHAVFGEGEVAAVEGNPSDPVIDVRFVQAGRRRLIARRAPIEVMEPPVQPA